MAHSLPGEGVEAAARPQPGTVEDAYAALEEFLTGDEPEEDEETDEPEGDEPDDEAVDSEEEGEEPDAPVIPAPASLTADEKAAFAQLPVEAQRLLADVETRRNTQVQQATTKAADAQRVAEAAAADAVMKAQAEQAERYRHFVAAYAPKAPDIGLLQSNPALYLAQKAQHDAETAHHNQLVEQIDAMAAEADKHFQAQEQAWQAEQGRILMTVPEFFADPAKRGPFLEGLTTLAVELGLPRDALANAGAADIMALHKASEWKAKAEKHDAAMTRKMQRVRDAKSTRPGVAKGVEVKGNRARAAAWDKAKTTRSGEDFANWLEASGHI